MFFLARDTPPRARSCFRAVFMEHGGIVPLAPCFGRLA